LNRKRNLKKWKYNYFKFSFSGMFRRVFSTIVASTERPWTSSTQSGTRKQRRMPPSQTWSDQGDIKCWIRNSKDATKSNLIWPRRYWNVFQSQTWSDQEDIKMFQKVESNQINGNIKMMNLEQSQIQSIHIKCFIKRCFFALFSELKDLNVTQFL
jgi:hypothetical protein